MQMFKHYFSKGSYNDGTSAAVDILAGSEQQIVVNTVVGYSDVIPPRIRVWEVTSQELEVASGPTHRSVTVQGNAGANNIIIDSNAGIGVGTKIYIRSDRNSPKYHQHIANVTNIVFMIPSGDASLALDRPLPYTFVPGDRVFAMSEQGRGIRCVQEGATVGDFIESSECLISAETRSPLHLEVYGADAELSVSGYWYDNA